MSDSHKTPKLPISKELSRFLRKVNSFSFENTSPEEINSSTTSDEVFESEATDRITEKLTTQGTDKTEETSNSNEPTKTTKESQQQNFVDTPEASTQTATAEEATSNEPTKTTEEIQKQNLLDALEHSTINSTTANTAPTEDLSLVPLRGGREYWRPRGNSVPSSTPSETKNKVSLVQELSIKTNTKEPKNKIKMESVNSLIFNIVPIYNGENKTLDISVFLKCCQVAHDSLETDPEKAVFVKLLPTRLRGRALDLVQEKTFTNISDFTKFIKDNFSDNKTYFTLNNELRMSQQLVGETLTSYLNRVKVLLEKCKRKAREHFSGMGNSLDAELNELAVNSFKLGILNPNHKFYLLQDPDTNLESITSKVQRLEQSEQYMFLNNIATPVTNSLITTHNPNIQQTTVNNTSTFNRNSNDSHSSNSPSTTQLKPDTTVKCGFCSRLGHSYAECRTRKSTPYCSYCKVYGHNFKTCTHKSTNYNNSRRYEDRNRNNNSDNNRAYNPRRQVHTINTYQNNSIDTAECNFCLIKGHTEGNCLAKERWEKRQLQEKLEKLQSGNGGETTANTPDRL